MAANPELMTGLGAAFSMLLCSVGSCYASVHAGLFAVRYSSYGRKRFLPIIISGVLSIYGIIISIILSHKLQPVGEKTASLSESDGYVNLAAGLAVGLSCLPSGLGIGKFLQGINSGQSMVKYKSSKTRNEGSTDSLQTNTCQPLLDQSAPDIISDSAVNFRAITLVLIFLEAIGLYGLIVALFLAK